MLNLAKDIESIRIAVVIIVVVNALIAENIVHGELRLLLLIWLLLLLKYCGLLTDSILRTQWS